MLTPRRIYEEELLDAGEGTDEDVAKSLTDLRRINRFLGGRKVVLRAISSCLDGESSERVSLLDVGTGSADIPMAVGARCRQQGLEAFIAGVDISERNLRVSRARLQVSSEIHLVQADSLRLPFAPSSFDFVTASLFLHHFRDDDVVRLLSDFGRIARRAVIINDLVRNLIPYYFTLVAGPILARSFLTRNDAPVSVLRGFTSEEMDELALRAGLENRKVRRMFPYRLLLIADVRNQKSGVRSQESGVRSQESEVRSQESGVRSQKSGVRSQKSGVRSQESGVRSRESGVRSQESGVRSQKSEARQKSGGRN